MADQDSTTAIHEAGHAVAHYRLDIEQSMLTIEPNPEKGTAGSSSAEGPQHVWSREDAEPMVLAFYAGYGALLAAGYPHEVAEDGAWSDFEQAEQLIEFWGLDGTPDEWRAKSAELMAQPENVAAVRRLADQLLQDRTIDGQLLPIYIEVADGEATEQELERAIALSQGTLARGGC